MPTSCVVGGCTLLNQVGWIDLRTRRKCIRLIMCFKILKGFININALKKFHPASRIGRNDNSLKFNVPFARTDCFKYSYFVRTADEWNSLLGSNMSSKVCL